MRSITINDQVWKWRVGVSTTVIMSPRGQKTTVQANLLTGRTVDGTVTPAHVRTYVEAHLLNTVKPQC